MNTRWRRSLIGFNMADVAAYAATLDSLYAAAGESMREEAAGLEQEIGRLRAMIEDGGPPAAPEDRFGPARFEALEQEWLATKKQLAGRPFRTVLFGFRKQSVMRHFRQLTRLQGDSLAGLRARADRLVRERDALAERAREYLLLHGHDLPALQLAEEGEFHQELAVTAVEPFFPAAPEAVMQADPGDADDLAEDDRSMRPDSELPYGPADASPDSFWRTEPAAAPAMAPAEPKPGAEASEDAPPAADEAAPAESEASSLQMAPGSPEPAERPAEPAEVPPMAAPHMPEPAAIPADFIGAAAGPVAGGAAAETAAAEAAAALSEQAASGEGAGTALPLTEASAEAPAHGEHDASHAEEAAARPAVPNVLAFPRRAASAAQAAASGVKPLGTGFWEDADQYMNEILASVGEIAGTAVLEPAMQAAEPYVPARMRGYGQAASLPEPEKRPAQPERTDRKEFAESPKAEAAEAEAGAEAPAKQEPAMQPQVPSVQAPEVPAPQAQAPAAAPETGSAAVSEEIRQLRRRYILGKLAGEDLADRNGRILIAKGQPITEAVMDAADREGKLAELIVNMVIPGLGDGI